jgi:hypothetical protein
MCESQAIMRSLRRSAFRGALLIAGVAVVALLLSLRHENPPHVLWFAFNRDAISVINTAGFKVVEVTSMSPEEIPVPIGARIWTVFPFRKRVRLPVNELEPTTLRIAVADRRGSGQVRCLARYHEGYVAVIVLRYPRGLQDEAAELGRGLRAAFPRERIELQADPPT